MDHDGACLEKDQRSPSQKCKALVTDLNRTLKSHPFKSVNQKVDIDSLEAHLRMKAQMYQTQMVEKVSEYTPAMIKFIHKEEEGRN